MDDNTTMYLYWLVAALLAGLAVLKMKSSSGIAKRMRDRLVPVTWAMIVCAFSLGATAIFWVVVNQ